MIMQAIVIGTVILLAYIWGSRGFFSALLHMLCVIVAGAVALALWEPLAYFILDKASGQWMVDMAWGVGLAIPFALTLAVIRMTMDKVVPLNADLDGVSNLVGGIVCGAVAGTITAGILVMSLSMLRVKQDFAMYKPIQYDNNGSLVRKSGLIYPADRITTWFYGYTSEAAFRSATPLAVWRPDMADDGQLLRTNFNEGRSRQTLKPSAFSVLGRYTVGANGRLTVDQLLAHSFSPGKHGVTKIDGESISGASKDYYLDAFVVKFKSGAREKEGRIVVGNGQLRLVCRDADDTASISLQPVALVSQGDQKAADRIDYGRWRFDKQEVFIASVGGSEDPPMAAEFLVPKGFHPLALYVKGVRVDVSEKRASKDYDTPVLRDAAIRNRSIVQVSEGGGTGEAKLNRGGAKTVNLGDSSRIDAPVRVVDSVLAGGILNKDNIKGLQIDDSQKILDGEAQFTNQDLQNRGLPQNLQVRRLAATEDTSIVQVDVSLKSELSLVYNQAAVGATGAPVLIDSLGQRYAAVGFMYQDSTVTHIRFLPGSPIQSISDLPKGGPSPSRQDQKFILVYRVTANVDVTAFAIGDTVVAEFSPKLHVIKR